MSFFFDLLDFLKRSKKSIWIVLAPIVLLPMLQFDSKEASCCYCILLLTFYWLGEVVPIAVTSILPMLLFPLLGVMTAEDTAREYLKDTTMMLVITVMAAIAVEECNLHRRIALKLLTKTGSKPQWIMASFMAATCFLSCWMDDCAATALMLPIAFATLESMNLDDEETGAKKPTAVTNVEAWTTVAVEHCDDPVKIPSHQEPPKEDRTIWKAMILSCSYASLIGGTGTVIGTAPNLIFRDNVQTWYPHGETGVTYLSWMAFAVPPMVLYLFASWVTLQIILIGPKKLFKMYARPTEEDEKKAVRVKNSILRAYQQLGPMSFAEKSVLTLYIVMILSWMTSDPGFMPGWQSLVPHGDMISDASVGILIIFIMFVWPRECPSFSVDASKPKKSSGGLLNWEVVHDKFPWSLLFLVGAGFATSRAVELSGLSTMVSCFAMDRLTNGSAFYMEIVITTFVTFVTELMGNSGTASIFIPISFSIGEALKINPLYLALPLTISASFSFMFPMATPPNAIVYETGMISMFEMAYTGFLLDLVCIGITLLNLNTWTFWLFDLGHFPEGIQDRNTTLMCAPSF